MAHTLYKTLYTSVDELIAPETLRELTGHAVTYVRCTSMAGGYAGSRLLRVETDSPPTNRPRRYVLKRMTPNTDWLMQTSQDHRCRAVTLWQHGLLDRLSPAVEHGIIACARDGSDGHALLMHDFSDAMMRPEPWTAPEVQFFLDALAAIHAAFWEAPELADPALGLCDAAVMAQMFAAEPARSRPSDTSPLPQMVQEGWVILQEWLESDTASVIENLLADPQPLRRALARYPATLVHGDYRGMNLGMASPSALQAIVLDWQLAGHSVATIDLAWFVTKPNIRGSALPVEAAVGYYRQRLADRLGERFHLEHWQPMWDLGTLVDILRMSAIWGWASVHGPSEESRSFDRENLKRINENVRTALRWL